VVEGGDLTALLKALTHADWDINTQHHVSSNKTLLHKAVQQGNAESVQILLDAGADYLIRDDNGNTPLELAAAHLQKECCAVLSKRVLEDMVLREDMLGKC
jgi:ankyrin repeat protein